MTDNTPTATPAFAICYLRVSTGAQADGGTSLETQDATTRAEAARRGATFVGTYTDDVSGALYARRAGLQDALARAEALRSQAGAAPQILFIVSKWDRSSRDVGVQREIERRLRACGAQLVSCDGTPTDASASSGLFRTIRSGFAEFEREVIRERTMEGRTESAREGRQPARSVRPFGYRIVQTRDVYPGSPWSQADVGRYVILEDEAAVVREIFARYGSGEWSLRSAAREMDRREVPTVRGGRWAAATVYGLLRNPVYVGRAQYGRLEHTRTERPDGSYHHQHRPRRADQVVTIPCPPLVPEATWQAVADRLATNQRTFCGNPDRRHLLSGLLRCPTCGRGLFGQKDKGGVYYTCRYNKACAGPGEVCSPRHWRGADLERLVLGAVEQLMSSPASVAAAIASARARRRGSAGDVDQLGAQVSEARRRESAAVEAELAAIADGRDATAYRAAVVGLSAKRRALEESLTRAQGADAKASDVDPALITNALGQAAKILSDPRLPLPERAIALRMIVSEVIPFDDAPARKASANPVPGARIRLTIRDSVGSITLHVTLSGSEVVVAPGGEPHD